MTGMGAGLTWGSALIEWGGAALWRYGRDRCARVRGTLRRIEWARLLSVSPARVRSRPDGARARRGGAGRDGGLSRRERGFGPRSPEALLRLSSRRARRDRGATAGADRDVPRHPGGHARRRARARHRGRPFGRRVRRARVGVGDGNGRGDRARARTGACDGGGSPAAPGLDGGDPRARGRGGRGAVPQDRRRLARELQLPGPDRGLRRERGGRGAVRRGRRTSALDERSS